MSSSLANLKYALPTILAAAALTVFMAAPAAAQMVTGDKMTDYAAALGVDPAPPKDFTVQETDVTSGASRGSNVLWPGEKSQFSFRVTNTTASAIDEAAVVHIINYGTRAAPGDVWTPQVFRIAQEPDLRVSLQVPANGYQDIAVTPSIPARFGGYALVMDIPGHGTAVAATLVRCLPPDLGAVQFPTYALDMPGGGSPETMTTFQRLGIKGVRMEFAYSKTTDSDYAAKLARDAAIFDRMKSHDLSVMLTVEGNLSDPLGVQFRSYLDDTGAGSFQYPGDTAWPPSDDPDFRIWTHGIAREFGWPKGPVNAMELWNEPWEGQSISGWGADIPRFREMYEQLALGVRDARAQDGTWVLSGGACSSTNTRDKLFPDGSQKFLPLLDFVSMHYQPMAADPALTPSWMTRPESMGGPVRVWDTESWIANSEDRIGGVIASMRSVGQSRTAGIYFGNVYNQADTTIDGTTKTVVQVFPPAAALAATQKFIGQRPFKQIVIKGGLPWVYEFGGRPLSPDDKKPGLADDGTLVILGDLGAIYDRNKMLFRTVYGLKNREEADLAAVNLAATSPESPDYTKATAAYATAATLRGASLTVKARREFRLYDFYGNSVPPVDGKFIIPLNDHGYFMRTDGTAGSFANLRAAVQNGRIDGIEPVEIVAHDMLARIGSHPSVRVSVNNVLNRPITGTLHLTVGGLTLDRSDSVLTIAPHTEANAVYTVVRGAEAADNQYPLSATFDAGKDGSAPHVEKIRVNVIAHRTIVVDGDLSDWAGVLPQPVSGSGIGATLTQQAWLPMQNFHTGDGSGVAAGFLAYDQDNFYFAAKIADSTPFDGMVRFATRDEEQYFYPTVSYDTALGNKAMVWPDGVRHYTYRKEPDIPGSDFPPRDNVLIAFNVVPEDKKEMWSMSPGTEPRYQVYPDTDYEYALDPVAPKYGGGTEIWRLLTPGMPRKMFYPHQPKSSFDGPVAGGKLVIRADSSSRIVECSLPWSELPLVKQALDAGRTVKFSFRVNDNGGPSYELAANRSVSKTNALTFHNDWDEHWSNELEFAFEK